jgi:hypothetical protein
MKANRRSQLAIVVASSAVAFALVGTAVAGPEAMMRAVSKTQVKKIAKKQANAVLDRRAATLDVNSARTAASATSAQDAAKLGGQPPSAYASSKVEPYHEVNSAGEPVFAAGWSNAGPTLTSAAFYKDPLGVVHLKGTVQRSGGTAVIFALPAGYRPAQVASFPTVGSSPPVSPTSVLIFTTGEVSIGAGGDDAYLLDGITFRAG